ncbi:MAG: tetraacyldisaccharide 4'-kinase [Mesorhizobium sp.]
MASEAPPFWWERPDWRARALWPLSAVYGLVASRRMSSARRERTGLPVLCIGNPTVGGSGKTPLAIALARAAKELGLTPGFLSRGHGGTLSRPHLVDLAHDSARSTGDEPLLLAVHAPTVVTPDRAAGARLLAGEGCDFLIMDDGFQSARIHFDYGLLVIDARRGLGNGHVLPGGPLRAPVVDQLRFADAVVRMGKGDGADEFIRAAARAARPIFDAFTVTRPGSGVEGRRLVAFAGIGDPSKFYATVAGAGADLAGTRSFADHHTYTDEDLSALLDLADAAQADLVTTEKDAVRIRQTSEIGQRLLARLSIVRIDVQFELPENAGRIVQATLDAFNR